MVHRTHCFIRPRRAQPFQADTETSLLTLYDLWLDPSFTDVAASDPLKPYEAAAMRAYPVSARVRSVANDDAVRSARGSRAGARASVLNTTKQPKTPAEIDGEESPTGCAHRLPTTLIATTTEATAAKTSSGSVTRFSKS
jgi:hypothetical protein